MADILEQVADFLEKGEYRKKVRVGITTLGSEHGTEEIIRGAELAQKLYDDVEVVLIGAKGNSSLHCYEAETLEGCHCLMEELLDKHEIDACVDHALQFPTGCFHSGKAHNASQRQRDIGWRPLRVLQLRIVWKPW